MFFRRLRLCDWRELLERETFSLLVEIGKEVWAKIVRNTYGLKEIRFGRSYTGLQQQSFPGLTREC